MSKQPKRKWKTKLFLLCNKMKSRQSLLIFAYYEWVLLLFIYYCSEHEIYSSDKTLSFAGNASSCCWSDACRLLQLLFSYTEKLFPKKYLSGKKGMLLTQMMLFEFRPPQNTEKIKENISVQKLHFRFRKLTRGKKGMKGFYNVTGFNQFSTTFKVAAKHLRKRRFYQKIADQLNSPNC